MREFSIIVAKDAKGGIGRHNALAWHLSSDLKHFKKITTDVLDPQKKNVVIMGRRTWESLPFQVRPLPKRINVVISSSADLDLPPNVLTFLHLDDALRFFEGNVEVESIFVIGGAMLYASSITHPCLKRLFITELKGVFDCDVFFPVIPPSFKIAQSSTDLVEEGLTYRFVKYIKEN